MARRKVERPGDVDYRRLLAFRTGLRTFIKWSEEQAATAGLAPMQHQLLLAIRGHGAEQGPTIGEAARYLLIKPHTAGELVDRAETAGLVRRVADPEDRRRVRLVLTDRASRKLERITAATLEELKRLAPALTGLWEGLEVEELRGYVP